MRIAYCTNVRLPNERAHGHQIAHVTQAMAEMGHDVEIFAPYRRNTISASFQAYYGHTIPLPLHLLGSFDGIASRWIPGVIGLRLTTALFSRQLSVALTRSPQSFDILYTRTPALLPCLLAQRKPVIMELHTLPRHGMTRFLRLLRRCRLVVAMTTPLRNELIEQGLVEVPIIVEGDAVDLRSFLALPDCPHAREMFHLPPDIPLIGYSGQLESMGLSKGIPELLDALSVLARRGFDFHCAIAGGPASAKARFVVQLSPDLASRVTFLGILPHESVPSFLGACDALVYPAPQSAHPFYMRDTSPLKIFEYMAAAKPIVSADLPPVRDILSEKNALLVPPGDSAALADALRMSLTDTAASAQRVKIARAEVENFTWTLRMQRILSAARLDV